MTLHWAKKVVVKVWDMNGLVYNQVVGLPSVWVDKSNNPTHGPVGLRSKGGVISLDSHWSIIV